MMRQRGMLLAALALCWPALASADPCPGPSPFTDVPAGASFCTNTEWLKNRAITLGCTATTFCPTDFVTRAQMALFMNRLATALTPSPLMTESQNTPFDLDVENFTCASPVYTVTDYPRRIVLKAHFSGLTNAAGNYSVTIRYNTDGNATTFPNPINGSFEKTGSPGASWTHASTSATLDLAVGTTYRFAIRLIRDSGAGDLTDSRCHLLQTLYNRNGSTSPFDVREIAGPTDE